MKRLMYAQLAYNPAYVSFENGWFDGTGAVSPIGTIQAAAKAWTAQYQLGVHTATVALVVDYFQGFVPPRQLVRVSVHSFVIGGLHVLCVARAN